MAIILSNLEQNTLDDFLKSDSAAYDLLIVAFAKDTRSRYVLGRVSAIAQTILAVCPTTEDCQTDRVKQFERRYEAKVDCFDSIAKKILEQATTAKVSSKEIVRIFVDVSSMPRTYMGEIFAQLREASRQLTLKLSIGYCLAKYVAPPDVKFPMIRRVAPVHPAFAGWGAPASLPVDAVVSLGYENGKAIGAVEYLEPRARWVFVPNSPEEKFLKQVKKHNDLLIESTQDTVIDYEVLKPVDTYYQLLSLVMGLVQESRPVLLPFGPKIFFAISLLVAMRVEKVSVWHVDGDDELPDAPPIPSAHTVVLSCNLTAEEELIHQ